MTLLLLAPAGLIALAAMALPLLLHLIRRLELKQTQFAALRWISERTRPQRRIRIDRPWLLLIRLLLLGLLALLLAQPVLTAHAPESRPWVLVAPGMPVAQARASTVATGAEWRWIAAGFPLIGDQAAPAAVPLASLLREADARIPLEVSMTVIVPAEVAGLDGELPRLRHAVDWHVVAAKMPDPPKAVSANPVTLGVRYQPDTKPALHWLQAAVDGWNAREPGRYRLDVGSVGDALPDTTNWLVWLADDIPPNVTRWIESGGTAMVVDAAQTSGSVIWRDADGQPLARLEKIAGGRIIRLASALDPAAFPAVLDADFPDQLLRLLAPTPNPPTRADAASARPLHDTSFARASSPLNRNVTPLDPWLALLIAALFAAERLLASRRPRSTS